MQGSYWTQKAFTRRAALRAATVSGGLAALSFVGCGGDDNDGASGAATSTTPSALDSTKGKPGGKIVIQAFGYAGGSVLVKTNNAGVAQFAGFTHSGLLELRNGTPAVAGDDVVSVGPDIAQALPEQVDDLTYRFKLKSAKFHNGRVLTSEDVKYSLDRYAFAADSAYKSVFAWLDKVEAPDAQTVTVKTKYPYGETLQSLAARNESFILAKEHEEGPDAATKMVGSGPFLFAETQAPVLTRFRKNPDYFEKPYPYFDDVELLGQSDGAKKVADFSSRQTHMTYWHGEEEYEQIKRARPDAYSWRWPAPGSQLIIRVDQKPFNDKRVRQALSMAVDRKAIREGVTRGNGEPDQMLSWTNKFWGTRKPANLGAAAKYWNYDVQAAKQLLSAAGVTQPIEAPFQHWDPTVIGQGIVDQSTLTQAQWRNAGIANMKDGSLTFGQYTTTILVGNYDGVYLGPGGFFLQPAFALSLRNTFWSPPEGVKQPTLNNGYVNDPDLSEQVDKHLRLLKVEDRRQALTRIEEIFAEQQYRIVLSTYFYNYFGEPTIKNMQVPIIAFNGGIGYVKYWWFDKA